MSAHGDMIVRGGTGSTRPPGELLEFLHSYPPPVQSLALAVRRLIHDELAPCHELIFAMRSKVVLAFGATERILADGVCNVSVFPKHVTLGFVRGVDLDDRAGLLKGVGKGMRHVRLYTLADLQRPAIRAYLRQARRNAGIRRRRGEAAEVVTRVKKTRPPAAFPWPRLP
jgi:Domain of unknown function (DU1801)